MADGYGGWLWRIDAEPPARGTVKVELMRGSSYKALNKLLFLATRKSPFIPLF
jgi:hypothetical protein